ncbi:MAG: hypothetical protein IH586_18005, partial [Anaerolineaceae bacterium]|nr:hypothetical protein [Anaerolineaceae bacterium]
YTLRVNGRKIYINGWNWVPMDVLYGVERAEKRERLLRLAREANVNLLRVWGGGLIEKKIFYDLCDRLGILVWQEFIQSSSGIDNVPSTDPAYIDLLLGTAEQAIIQRRNHPSLGVWSGGNELHETAQRLCDTSHPALAALKGALDRLDPGRHWVATSPAGGEFGFCVPSDGAQAARLQDVHGPWEYQGLRAQYTLYNQGRSLLHSEFGVEGLTNRRALDAVIPLASQVPVSLENPLWKHLGFWWVKEQAWAEIFDPLADVETTRRATQFLQADGLRYAVEADRRRQFVNAGTMPWQFNEPYPMAACTSAVDYFAEPKPVYYTVARAYRPLTVSARFDTLAWNRTEPFRAEICCSNTRAAGAGSLSWRLAGLDGKPFCQETLPAALPENGSKVLHRIEAALAEIPGDVFFLDLILQDMAGNELAANRYTFTHAANLAPLLAVPNTQIQASLARVNHAWEITLRNNGAVAALCAWLEAEKSDLHASGWAAFSDNYLTLLPGEERKVRVEWSEVPEERTVTISGWNFAQVTIRA